MKRITVKAFWVGFTLACLNAVLNNCTPVPNPAEEPSNGIVILPGYPNAVAICGPAEHGFSDAIVVTRGNHALYINLGHYNDQEINQLSTLATKHCKKLR